jgi:hypothetical protein
VGPLGRQGQFKTRSTPTGREASDSAKEIIAVYAKLIRETAPTGKWIVGYHGGEEDKRGLVDVPEMLEAALKDLHPFMLDHDYEPDPDWEKERDKLAAQGLTIACLNWGRHDATSAFKLFDHVIAMGALYLTRPVLESKVRAAGRHPASREVTEEQMEEAERGELRHLYLQFLNRSAARVSDGDRCRPVRFWLNAKRKSKVDAELLQATFPGCTVVEWVPVERPTTRVEEAWQTIEEHFRSTTAPLFFRAVYQEMGMDRTDFRKGVRRHPEFLKLCQGKIHEVLVGKKGAADAFGLVNPAANPFRPASVYDFGFEFVAAPAA